jgi:hypothetical protein
MGLVGRVREMLRFHAETVPMVIDPAILTPERAVQEVAGIEL